MTTIRAFFSQIRAIFSNFRKSAGETFPSPLQLRPCRKNTISYRVFPDKTFKKRGKKQVTQVICDGAEFHQIQKQSPGLLHEKSVLKIFSKFTGKHLCQRLFFNEVAVVRVATLLKKSLTQVFSCKSWEIFRNIFFYKTPLGDCFCRLVVRKFTSP